MTVLSNLYARLPHALDMRLIEEIVSWDKSNIYCQSRLTTAFAHPLQLDDGSFPVICLLEYAAQALALHGLLCTSSNKGIQSASIISCKRLAIASSSITNCDLTIDVSATLRAQSSGAASYRVSVTQGDDNTSLLRGDLMVLLTPA